MIAMPVPAYQDLLQPMLKILSLEGEEMSKTRLVESLAAELGLEHDAVNSKLPSGSGTFLEHNIDWARTHLQMQGLLEGSLEQGIRLTSKGWDYAGQYYPDLVRKRFSAPPVGPAECPHKLEAATRLL